MTTRETLLRLFATHAGPDAPPIEPGSWLQDLGLDSIATMGLVVDIEDEFDVVLDQTTLLGLKTIAELTAWLESARRS